MGSLALSFQVIQLHSSEQKNKTYKIKAPELEAYED